MKCTYWTLGWKVVYRSTVHGANGVKFGNGTWGLRGKGKGETDYDAQNDGGNDGDTTSGQGTVMANPRVANTAARSRGSMGASSSRRASRRLIGAGVARTEESSATYGCCETAAVLFRQLVVLPAVTAIYYIINRRASI